MIHVMDDHELLREYVRDRSQDAFRELVDRHLPMVYGAARRMVRDSHLAEDVAQGTFQTLAKKAGKLRRHQVVAGWLYQTTRHLAMHAVRGEQRRREREQVAVAMQALDAEAGTSRILEELEPALDQLEAGDRDRLVLRFRVIRSGTWSLGWSTKGWAGSKRRWWRARAHSSCVRTTSRLGTSVRGSWSN